MPRTSGKIARQFKGKIKLERPKEGETFTIQYCDLHGVPSPPCEKCLTPCEGKQLITEKRIYTKGKWEIIGKGRQRKELTLEKLQMDTNFINLISSIKKQGGKVYLHGGMLVKRKSSNDIDLYVEGIPYQELPQDLYIAGLPVSFALMKSEEHPYFEL